VLASAFRKHIGIREIIGLKAAGVLPTIAVDDRVMSALLQRRLLWGLILFFFLAGCSTADHDAANFRQAQKLRQNALLAAQQGDTASALEDIDRVQVLEPLSSRSSGSWPPPLRAPEHRTIAPAAGQTTCNNIGINRFSCF
jgi:hypothetical protein